jgi:hypothetical protein
MRTKLDTEVKSNQIKSNHKEWNWKIISIKKRIKKNNKKKKNQIWYKNQMLRDEIEKKNNPIKDSIPNTLQ